MPQEFKAIIIDTKEISQSRDVSDTYDDGMEKVELIKSALFLLQSSGPCPWPPGQLQGKVVRIIIEN